MLRPNVIALGSSRSQPGTLVGGTIARACLHDGLVLGDARVEQAVADLDRDPLLGPDQPVLWILLVLEVGLDVDAPRGPRGPRGLRRAGAVVLVDGSGSLGSSGSGRASYPPRGG